MKMSLKKILATLAAAVTAVSVGSVFSTSASAATFLQGDANGDGVINSLDAMYVNYYLLGMVSADGMTLARMDCDSDKVITRNDYNIIMRMNANLQTPVTITADALTTPENSQRTYRRYDVVEGKAMTDYTLSAVPSMEALASVPTVTSDYIQYEDNENINVVSIQIPTGYGTGFIVSDHLIATAAHCVYDTQFIVPTSIKIYDEDGTSVIGTATPLEIHVPVNYRLTSSSSYDYNYDYALIYVEEDLSEYGVWSMGICTNEFLTAQSVVSSSGFTNINGIYRRYFSTGNTIPYGLNNSTQYRIESTAQGYPGKSGGPTYCTVAGNSTINAAIGINSAVGYYDDINTGQAVYLNNISTRVTPSVARFYYNNTYAE